MDNNRFRNKSPVLVSMSSPLHFNTTISKSPVSNSIIKYRDTLHQDETLNLTNFKIRPNHDQSDKLKVLPSLDRKPLKIQNDTLISSDQDIFCLRSELKKREQMITNLQNENKGLKDKITRISTKMKKFIQSYRKLKTKLDTISKLNTNPVTDLTNQYSTDSFDIPKSKNHLSLSFIKKPKRMLTCKFDDNLSTKVHDLSVSIAESDYLGDKLKNRVDLSKSVEYRNDEISFRSTENVNNRSEAIERKMKSNTDLCSILRTEEYISQREVLGKLKDRVRKILELYQSKFEAVKRNEI